MELIDDCFYVKKQPWGTWDSVDKNGEKLVTSFTEEDCLNATRFFLKTRQEKENGTL